METSKQKIFDTVWNGLKSQNFKQSMRYGTCVYRGENGLKCAAGWLLPDEEWIETRNEETIDNYPWFTKNFKNSQFQLIQELQEAHDALRSDDPEYMKERLTSVAIKYKLEVPE